MRCDSTAGSISAIALPSRCAIHNVPFDPGAISPPRGAVGWPVGVKEFGKSIIVIMPAVEMRPIRFSPPAWPVVVNHKSPPGPVVIPFALPEVGKANEVNELVNGRTFPAYVRVAVEFQASVTSRVKQ